MLDASLLVRDALDTLKMPSYPKTSGSKGLHIYVPIKRGITTEQFTMDVVLDRVARLGDIHAAVLKGKVKLPF